jgi:hypothetical protein
LLLLGLLAVFGSAVLEPDLKHGNAICSVETTTTCRNTCSSCSRLMILLDASWHKPWAVHTYGNPVEYFCDCTTCRGDDDHDDLSAYVASCMKHIQFGIMSYVSRWSGG